MTSQSSITRNIMLTLTALNNCATPRSELCTEQKGKHYDNKRNAQRYGLDCTEIRGIF
jgi:hypothetical protein